MEGMCEKEGPETGAGRRGYSPQSIVYGSRPALLGHPFSCNAAIFFPAGFLLI